MKKLMASWGAAMTAVLFLLANPATAQQLGGEYTEISPPLVADNQNQIEVIEFFSYACPHCSDLNPTLIQWTAKLPADVSFRKVAVGFGNPFYQMMAKLYYSLDAMGESSRLDEAVFQAIHDKGIKFTDEKSITSWVVSQGINGKTFAATFGSFGVSSQAKRADLLADKAKIPGVPSLLVDGRYLVGGPNIKTSADLLTVADKLIAKARLERKGKK
jgi:thiol:disulfide interchange protein DsbA